MDVKELLRQLPQMEARIRSKEAQIRKYREMATRATSSTEAARVSGTGSRSRVEDAVVKICDLEAEVRRELYELEARRGQAVSVIGRVSDIRFRDVLEMHYITGWSLRRVAAEMHYDERWVQILHGKALNAAREIFAREM